MHVAYLRHHMPEQWKHPSVTWNSTCQWKLIRSYRRERCILKVLISKNGFLIDGITVKWNAWGVVSNATMETLFTRNTLNRIFPRGDRLESFLILTGCHLLHNRFESLLKTFNSKKKKNLRLSVSLCHVVKQTQRFTRSGRSCYSLPRKNIKEQSGHIILLCRSFHLC